MEPAEDWGPSRLSPGSAVAGPRRQKIQGQAHQLSFCCCQVERLGGFAFGLSLALSLGWASLHSRGAGGDGSNKDISKGSQRQRDSNDSSKGKAERNTAPQKQGNKETKNAGKPLGNRSTVSNT